MTPSLPILDHATRDDLRIFLERLQRSALPEVRVITRGTVLAVFGCTQAPAGLLDSSAVVLVQRTFELSQMLDEDIDMTVLGRALLDRIARLGIVGLALELPDTAVTVAWAGVLPPRSGWQAAGAIDASSLASVAEQGIARVAEALPDQPGEAVVRTVRAAVWGAEVAPGVPAAAAFAAEVMGFLLNESIVRLASTATWTRLITSRGQVIVRSPLN